VQHVVALAVTRWDERLANTFITLRHKETTGEDYVSKHVQYEEENGPSISQVSSVRSNGDHVRQRCKVSLYVERFMSLTLVFNEPAARIRCKFNVANVQC